MENEYDEKENMVILFSATAALTLAAWVIIINHLQVAALVERRNTLLKSLTTELQLRVEH